jgi:uncharacterized protein YozE (UPF0346 family)
LGNPIKTFLKQYYFSGTYNKSAYNFLLLSENPVTMKDAMLYGPSVISNYIETKVDYSTLMERQDNEGTNAYISLYI